MSTATLPTDTELRQEFHEASEALRLVRVAVAEGTADAAQLAEAEHAYRHAETRISSIAEARLEQRRRADRRRAGEIVAELAELDPLIAQQHEREQQIREIVTAYLDTAREIRTEVAGAYWELDRMKDSSRDMLAELGIRVTAATTAVRIAGTTYPAADGLAFLRELEREAGNKGGTLSARPKPIRRRKAA